MKTKNQARSLLEQKYADPTHKKAFETAYEAFKLEVQLLNAIEKKGMTYEDLAKALHTKRSNISRDLRQGGIYTANLRRIQRMAELVGLTLIPVMIPSDKASTILPRLERLLSA